MNDMTSPNHFSRRVLYSVLGLSPQILTETLYALQASVDPWIPTEIHVLTTLKGAQHCRLALFSENGGWFHRFCNDYNLQSIHFDESCIHVLKDNKGNAIDDIRTPEENNAVANLITSHIREITSDPNTAIHVSIAGGRKTMGFYAGYVLSMYGREQDRLSHVLVEPKFEGHPNFFYPTPYSQVIRTHDQQELLEVREAKVDLAYLPIVRMRHAIDQTLVSKAQDFSELVAHLQQSFEVQDIEINIHNRTLTVDKNEIKLSPVNFAFYLWLVDKRKENVGIIVPPEGYPDESYRDEFIKMVDQVIGDKYDMDRSLSSIQNGMTKEFISQRKTSIKKQLKESLGVNAKHYEIIANKKGGQFIHSLSLDLNKIHIS
ncbi:CRISPR-associated ring nuclease Csm6 [Thiomicrospira microaerophila]|uniref:CRISPR-associated ring nuclease Csm6 n=1 Tax=Thiomicrospira microaerophila TaxID=406020 RepID=UPI0005C848B3|nr:CRISPR-associated ring nuclease Csm6 [Thiomicrospira microaerophila]